MKKAKWFSMIEMLIVISIILTFMIIFQNFFKPKDMQIYQWQKCVNDIYNFVNTFINAWLTNKWFYSWTDMIYPNAYKTEIRPSENKITNSIDMGMGYIQLQTANLSWINTENLCYIDSIYNILITWAAIDIEITKWISNNQFNISDSTWHTDLFLCKWNNIWCKHIWQYVIDKRSQSIIRRVCLNFSWNNCSQWNQ